MYRHGDLSFHPLKRIPESAEKLRHNGQFVLAYGEHTGNKHVITCPKMEIFKDGDGNYVLKLLERAEVTHEEHKTITIEPGIWIQKIEREYNPFEEKINEVQD